MTVSINGSGGLTFNDNSVQSTAASGFGFKNRIINGAMVIDQRNAGASVTVNNASNNTFSVDRWQGAGETTDGVFTLQRSTVAPAGFVNSMLATVTTADASIGASQRYFIQQRIEGFNMADLNWGSANAATVTLSFWVRSSVTGTYGGSMRNSAGNRSYPFTYAISAADTWEYKSVTIAGDTTGTWLTDNGIGVFVTWGLGVGSSLSGTAGAWAASGLWSATSATNLMATNGATFYITGVQLEKGSTATSFDYRPYSTELALCQRYCLRLNDPSNPFAVFMTGAATTASNFYGVLTGFNMRAMPTATYSGLWLATAGTGRTITNITAYDATNGTVLLFIQASGMTAGHAGILQQNNSASGFLQLSAEL